MEILSYAILAVIWLFIAVAALHSLIGIAQEVVGRRKAHKQAARIARRKRRARKHGAI